MRAAVDTFLSTEAPAWLESRRWFADKGRHVVAVNAADLLIDRVGANVLALCVATVQFVTGSPETYFLPLATTSDPENSAIAPQATSGLETTLVDAADLDWFGGRFLDIMASEARPLHRSWQFEATAFGKETIERARGEASRQIVGEQSNSSMRVGDEIVLKLIRRLRPGPNPEQEVVRALGALHFSHVPEYVGGAAWHAPDGVVFPIAMAQDFVPNQGDGWTWALDRLVQVRSHGFASLVGNSEPERQLGRRTAELHLALSEVDNPDFRPVLANEAWIGSEARRTLEQLESCVTLLNDRALTLPAPLQGRIPEIVSEIREQAAWVDGLRDEFAIRRIRVHGDYHLGQVLRTIENDWSIIDFEGEPARPTLERRQRTSALKDVAGMLRSFSYARGAAEHVLERGDRGARARLANWEQAARDAFVAGYRETMPGSARLIPDDNDAFLRALRAWELDKALYEISYEITNRPSWLALPLRAFLPGLIDHPASSSDTAPA